MPFTNEHDNSKQKRERRLTVYKLAKRRRAVQMLATNYPGPYGRKFVMTKLVKNLGVNVTLCERTSFRRDSSELDKLVTKMPHTDVFFQMLSNSYDFLDLDLCGSLSADALKSLETCTSWKTVVLTITDKFRSRWGSKSAKPANVHIQNFIMDWCKTHDWNCQLGYQPLPYRRYNKNELRGLADGRGPWYYTFVITRD